MGVFDKLLGRVVEERRTAAQIVEQGNQTIFEHDVVEPLKPYLDGAEQEAKQIDLKAVEVSSIMQRLAGSRFEVDPVIARSLHELQGLLGNAHCLRTGLSEYRQLSWKNLLGRNGLIDRNAARNLTGRLRGFFPKGTIPAIEQQIRIIQDRLAFLMEHSTEAMPSGAEAEAVIIPPQPTPAEPIVLELQDPRLVK